MRGKRWLISLVALLGLFAVGNLHKPSIHAMPSIKTARGMQYWHKLRHVRAKRGFKAIEIHDTNPEANSYTVSSRYIKRGTPLYVSFRGIEWDWTLSNRYFNTSRGYKLNRNYWIAGGSSSKWTPYRQKRFHHPGAEYVKARFKQINSARKANKSGYSEYERLINKKDNGWYEHIKNYYNPNDKRARILASWDFYPKDYIYWTNTRTGTTYVHYHKNIWKKVN